MVWVVSKAGGENGACPWDHWIFPNASRIPPRPAASSHLGPSPGSRHHPTLPGDTGCGPASMHLCLGTSDARFHTPFSAHCLYYDCVESCSQATLLVVGSASSQERLRGEAPSSLSFCSAPASGLATCSQRTPDLTFITFTCEAPSSSTVASHATPAKIQNQDAFSTADTREH